MTVAVPSRRRAASAAKNSFAAEAAAMWEIPIALRVNALGGYGPDGQVIYEGHPFNCPSVLVDSQGGAKATFMSNGSVDFLATMWEGFELRVLDGSFEPVEKREKGVPSSNVWINLGDGKIASLTNPAMGFGLKPKSIRIVKLGDPRGALWSCAEWADGKTSFRTAVRYSLATHSAGPAITRQIHVRNTGKAKLNASLFTYFQLHGTQRFVYNKELWYDAGQPLSLTESVVAATVPYSDYVQVKRVSTAVSNAKPVDATCDYATFVGDTGASALLPQAVIEGGMLDTGSGRKLNRFTTTSIAANQFALTLPANGEATVRQSLLYVSDPKIRDGFRDDWASDQPSYQGQAEAFAKAGKRLLSRTPDVLKLTQPAKLAANSDWPAFAIDLPYTGAASRYANSVWTGVKELYENCRAHGAKLADGIELGTRDRAQDMWPKLKEDPGRIRADLIHALGFMYVTQDKPPVAGKKPLTLRQKLHGMFPRQYPSRWSDRSQPVKNDNRPYTDSPLWLIDALNLYLRETGDISILNETVTTVHLTEPDTPITSSIIGAKPTQTVLQVVFEIFECFARHAADCPYGICQALYGDWCDPVDMFGTSVVGDASTRGQGRGGHVRLSAHVFSTAVATLDAFAARPIAQIVSKSGQAKRIDALKQLADTLRQNLVRVAWEDVPAQRNGKAGKLGPREFHPAFLNVIHELRRDGSRPNYAKGETGYTLGSMLGTDFDGMPRRELLAQAYCLSMLNTHREYLQPVRDGEAMIAKILNTIDRVMEKPKLGLVMFVPPIANNALALQLVGRMGVVPTGCAENGEYHHAQVMMHRFRLDVPGQADIVWRQFKPIMSAMRDETLGGPFETPCTSYASDVADPHFGQGMYFGLSGSVDWIVEVFHKVIGLQLNLHDPDQAAVTVEPTLSDEMRDDATFRRLIHCATSKGEYRRIPLEIRINRRGKGAKVSRMVVKINGKATERAEVRDLDGLQKLEIELTRMYAE